MTTVKIIRGNCLDIIPTLPRVDCIISDPPYGIRYQSNRRKEKMARITNDERPFVEWVAPAAERLKDGGCMIIFCRWDSWHAFQCAVEDAGLTVKSQIVWIKNNWSSGDLRCAPGNQHEIAMFATKGRFTFHGKRPSTVGTFARVSKMEHPTEKPVALMRWLVEHYCPPGGAVLDPCAGVAPVGVACAMLGREYYGIELDERYVDIAKRRIAQCVLV